MVASTQPEAHSMAASQHGLTECPVIDGSGPNQCQARVASNACKDVPPGMQQEDTTRYSNTTIAIETSMPALTKDRLKFNDLHYDHNAASCHDLSKAIELQQAGLELNFALPLHCYMQDKSRFDQWVGALAK